MASKTKKELSARKSKVLQAVIDSYIKSCEPVSSLEIHERFFPALSPATIRNELAILEELGLLERPHISSGRIPTAEGYRVYVDRMMPKKRLTQKELRLVKQYFKQKANDIESMVLNTAKIISEITNLTAIGYVKAIKTDVINQVKIVKISPLTALFIIITDHNVLKDGSVKFRDELDEQYLSEASMAMSAILNGHNIEEVLSPGRFAKTIKKEYERIFDAIINILKNYGDDGIENISIEGSSKIFLQPEYNNLNKARAMLQLLDTKERLYPLLNTGDMNINIKIGKNDEIMEGIPECSIISASYSVDGHEIGSAGVIGPIRMDYSKVVSVLDYIGKTIREQNAGQGDESDAELDVEPDEEKQ